TSPPSRCATSCATSESRRWRTSWPRLRPTRSCADDWNVSSKSAEMLARVDTANRAFATLLAVVVAASLVIGVIGCCVIAVVSYRLGTNGLSALDKPGTVPALVLLGLLSAGAILGGRTLRHQS